MYIVLTNCIWNSCWMLLVVIFYMYVTSGQYKTQNADCRPGTNCRLGTKCRLQTADRVQNADQV